MSCDTCRPLRHALYYLLNIVSLRSEGTRSVALPDGLNIKERIDFNSMKEGAWQRLSAGDGTKGERLYDWAYCELADLDGAEYNEALSGLWTRGLLIRRSLSDGEFLLTLTFHIHMHFRESK